VVEDVTERLALLDLPAFAPIEAWRRTIAKDRIVPHVDPLDAGTDATVLILLETPGPGSSPVRFVSRDNGSGTQRNLSRFLAEAGVPRRATLLWNCVPWVLEAGGERRAVRRDEMAEGLSLLPGLLTLLPRLRVAVLAGRVAARAEGTLRTIRPELVICAIPHPSPANVCTSPAVAAAIRTVLRQVALTLVDGGRP
jgi:hypothetical protein